MRRPKVPWLERQSTNRDAVLVGLGFVLLPLIFGVLDSTGVFNTLPLGAWIALALVVPALWLAYRLGRRSSALVVPPDVGRYVEHTTDAIDTLQLLLRGEIDPIAVREFIQEGIFEPAHAILTQRDRGDVRFSILHPNDAGTEFSMALALGHSIESRRVFQMQIAGSFAGMTYSDGEPRVCNDTREDDRFTPHPHARPGREYRSIVAAPIRYGRDIDGVFVVLAEHPNAFGDGEVAYVRELAAIVGLARSITTPEPDDEGTE
jgi:GAF domain-containing protein